MLLPYLHPSIDVWSHECPIVHLCLCVYMRDMKTARLDLLSFVNAALIGGSPSRLGSALRPAHKQ